MNDRRQGFPIILYVIAIILVVILMELSHVKHQISDLPTPHPTPWVWPTPLDPLYIPTRGIES
jgi:hypothetical protein